MWLATVLMAVLVLVTAVSLWTPYLRVCSGEGVSTSCRPLQLQDPPILLVVLLAFGVVSPDIKRFKFAGFEFERRDTIKPGRDLEPEAERSELKFEQFVKAITEGEESQHGSPEDQ